MASICSAQKRGYNAHDAAAFGARGRADVCLRRRSLVSRGPGALDPFEKSGPTQGELCGATAIGHEAEVADAVEAVWQSVQEKATDERVGRELDDLAGAVLAIILPGESDVIIFDGGQAAVGDGDAVCIATEIGERLGGSTERLLCLDDPVDAAHGLDEGAEARGIGEIEKVAEEVQGAGVVGFLQTFEEQTAEEFCERPNG